MKTATLLSILVFSVVAIAHLVRLVSQAEIVVGGAVVPMWVSGAGLVVTATLAIALWREAV